jgi:hypothetical protein
MKFKSFLISLGGLAVTAMAAERDYLLYEVKKNDSLSTISYQFCKKVHGPQGFLLHVLKWNPQLKQPIHPGIKLKIPTDNNLCVQKHESAGNSTEVSSKGFTPLEDEHASSLPYETELIPSLAPLDLPVAASASREWIFDLMIGTKSLKARDSFRNDAVVNSNHLLNLGGAYKFAWSSNQFTTIGGGLRFENYFESNRKVVNPSSPRTRIFLNHELHRNKHIFNVQGGILQQTIIGESDSVKINLEVIPVKDFSLGWKYQFFNTPMYNFFGGGSASYLLAAPGTDLRLKSGYEGKVFGEVQDHRGSWQIFYSYGEQNSNIFKNRFDVLGLKYSLRFGGEKN